MSAKPPSKGPHRAPVEPAHRPSPEGPYETERMERGDRPAGRDPFRFPDLVLAIQEVRHATLKLSHGERELRMIIELVRNHDLGRVVTSTSLAASSGLTYGTAMRAIDDLIKRGLVIKRPKTETDRSFSLHPSLDLLAGWQQFARVAEDLMRRQFVTEAADGPRPRARALKMDPSVVAPLPVLDTKLPLGGALRVLVHADPTFTAMNTLRRHFEMVLGVPITSRALSIDRLRAEIIANSRPAPSPTTTSLPATCLVWRDGAGQPLHSARCGIRDRAPGRGGHLSRRAGQFPRARPPARRTHHGHGRAASVPHRHLGRSRR